VPYRRRANTRSIRRFIAIRPITDDPTRMLHADGARRRLDVVSHSAGSPSRRMLARILAELGERARSIPGWMTERRTAAMAVSAAVLLAAAVAAVVTARMTAPPQAAPPQAAPPRVGGAAEPPPGFAAVPSQQRDITGPSQQASAQAGSANPSTSADPVVLTASYRTASTWIGGYRGEVTIRNGGDADVDGWTSTITLPLLGLTVGSVHGAKFRQNGRTVTFTPAVDTGTVSSHGQVHFDFSVDGVGEPIDCTVDDRPCAGVSG
jgi:hypothetical protein